MLGSDHDYLNCRDQSCPDVRCQGGSNPSPNSAFCPMHECSAGSGISRCRAQRIYDNPFCAEHACGKEDCRKAAIEGAPGERRCREHSADFKKLQDELKKEKEEKEKKEKEEKEKKARENAEKVTVLTKELEDIKREEALVMKEFAVDYGFFGRGAAYHPRGGAFARTAGAAAGTVASAGGGGGGGGGTVPTPVQNCLGGIVAGHPINVSQFVVDYMMAEAMNRNRGR
jgi:hypothetical protein